MKTKEFTQIVLFRASAETLYNALMDSETHSAFTGGEAVIGRKEGDPYSAYGGYISGKNVELVPGKKIVQTWKAIEDGWPDGHWSTIEILLKKTGNGTELTLRHRDIPATVKADFESGWEEYYWEPMKELLEK